MPNEDQDMWIGGDGDIEMRSDENVEPKTQADIKLLSTQVCRLDRLEFNFHPFIIENLLSRYCM